MAKGLRADVYELRYNGGHIDQPYKELCYAVVVRACMDYRHALKIKKRSPKSKRKSRYNFDSYGAFANADDTIKECEYFFLNDLSLWCDLDGRWIMERIRGSVNEND